ncbi:MAG: hypothetical protein LQ340_003294, partial [Diploschistes diacapsis]
MLRRSWRLLHSEAPRNQVPTPSRVLVKQYPLLRSFNSRVLQYSSLPSSREALGSPAQDGNGHQAVSSDTTDGKPKNPHARDSGYVSGRRGLTGNSSHNNAWTNRRAPVALNDHVDGLQAPYLFDQRWVGNIEPKQQVQNAEESLSALLETGMLGDSYEEPVKGNVMGLTLEGQPPPKVSLYHKAAYILRLARGTGNGQHQEVDAGRLRALKRIMGLLKPPKRASLVLDRRSERRCVSPGRSTGKGRGTLAKYLVLQGRTPPEKVERLGYTPSKDKRVRVFVKSPEDDNAEKDPNIRREAVKIDRKWLPAFARINIIHRSDMRAHEKGIPNFVHSFSQFMRRTQSDTGKRLITQGSISSIWFSKSLRWKRVWWRSAMLYALLMSPIDALHIVQDLCRKPYLPVLSHVIQDVFDHVTTTEVENVKGPSNETVDLIVQAAVNYLGSHYHKTSNTALSARTVAILSKQCSGTQLDDLRRALTEAGFWFSPALQVHIMTRYVQLKRLGTTLEILQSLPLEALRGELVQNFCALIIRAPWEVDDLYGLQTRLLTFMLELGLVPNRPFHNASLMNSMEAGDRDLAWQSYHMMRENGLLPDAHTYSALLKGVKHGDDLNTINSIYHEARKDGSLTSSPTLANHFLNALYYYYHGRGQRPFNAMLAFYAEIYDLQPLYDLAVLHPQDLQHHPRPAVMGGSTDRAVTWLLIAWLKENVDHTARIREVYERYLEHVGNRHPIIALLAEKTFVPTAFILAFGRNRLSLQMCTTVVQNMLKPPYEPVDRADQTSDEDASGTFEGQTASSNMDDAPKDQLDDP